MSNMKEHMHIRITQEVYSNIASIAQATRRTIGAMAELIIMLGLETYNKSNGNDTFLQILKEGGSGE